MKKLLVILLLFGISDLVRGQDERLWATYYGGNNIDHGNSVVTDIVGNVYMAGQTKSDTGISFQGFQNNRGGNDDAYLVKFDSTGNRLWATYFGGQNIDHGYSVVTDLGGNIYMGGYTISTSDIAYGGFQNSYGGGFNDAFLVKFDSTGNRLWSTYYGGDGKDYCWSIATDFFGNVYMAGTTTSIINISSNGFQSSNNGVSDAFLVKFDSNGNRIWATYYGGISTDNGSCIATDLEGNVYMIGMTTNNDDISYQGFQNIYGGNSDAFLVKFDSLGNRIWASYYGGAENEYGWSVATDIFGNVYISGNTKSTEDISSSGFQNTFGGSGAFNSGDAFVVKFDSEGNRLWATYYGGENDEEGLSVTTDMSGNVYLGGDTYSSENVTFEGYQNGLLGQENLFVVKFDTSGNRICATCYGIGHDEEGHIAVDIFDNIYLSGITSNTFGIASEGFQNTYGGGDNDSYLVKFHSCINNIIVKPDNEIEIPNFVTPNGDNLNDYFEIIYTLEDDAERPLTIYNRWGNKIYETDNYLNDWDGDKHSAGTYFYVLTLPDGNSHKGTITLIK